MLEMIYIREMSLPCRGSIGNLRKKRFAPSAEPELGGGVGGGRGEGYVCSSQSMLLDGVWVAKSAAGRKRLGANFST